MNADVKIIEAVQVKTSRGDMGVIEYWDATKGEPQLLAVHYPFDVGQLLQKLDSQNKRIEELLAVNDKLGEEKRNKEQLIKDLQEQVELARADRPRIKRSRLGYVTVPHANFKIKFVNQVGPHSWRVRLLHEKGLPFDEVVITDGDMSDPSRFREWLSNRTAGYMFCGDRRMLEKIRKLAP
jgi:hypothetical protein